MFQSIRDFIIKQKKEQLAVRSKMGLTKSSSLNDLYDTKKGKLRNNIIEFVVGCVLLTFCRQYLQHNPAEKIAITSWVELMYERITVFVGNVLYGDGQIRQDKQSLLRAYDEILAQWSMESCKGKIHTSLIKQKRDELRTMTIDQYRVSMESFKIFLSMEHLKIKESCGN
jgi:hypothetical protein